LAALSARPAPGAIDPLATETDQLATATAPSWSAMLDAIRIEVDQATDLAALSRRLTEIYGGLAIGEMVRVMAAAFALAELKGMADAQGG
jgi:hypothetical protein